MNNFDDAETKKNDLPSEIKKIAGALYYTSETDAEITAFSGKKSESVSADELFNQIERKDDAPVEEKDFTDFFARLTAIQDWFGDEEKATAQKFTDLKDLLEKNLKDIKVFRIGAVQIDIYVVGLDRAGNLAGIQTKAVET